MQQAPPSLNTLMGPLPAVRGGRSCHCSAKQRPVLAALRAQTPKREEPPGKVCFWAPQGSISSSSLGKRQGHRMPACLSQLWRKNRGERRDRLHPPHSLCFWTSFVPEGHTTQPPFQASAGGCHPISVPVRPPPKPTTSASLTTCHLGPAVVAPRASSQQGLPLEHRHPWPGPHPPASDLPSRTSPDVGAPSGIPAVILPPIFPPDKSAPPLHSLAPPS